MLRTQRTSPVNVAWQYFGKARIGEGWARCPCDTTPLVYGAVQRDIGAVFIIGTVDKHRRVWGQGPRGRVVAVKVAAVAAAV